MCAWPNRRRSAVAGRCPRAINIVVPTPLASARKERAVRPRRPPAPAGPSLAAAPGRSPTQASTTGDAALPGAIAAPWLSAAFSPGVVRLGDLLERPDPGPTGSTSSPARCPTTRT